MRNSRTIMKLMLYFVLCFNFIPISERTVLQYILSVYSEQLQDKPNNKAKVKAKQTSKQQFKNTGLKLTSIFEILQRYNINPSSSADNINPTIKGEIAKVLGIDRDLDEIFIEDKTLTQHKGVINYQLFGHKFQIFIQYSGHLAKVYFNNMMKCTKCYIQDGKAWVAFVLKHDLGEINEVGIKDILDNEVLITLEYNDNLENKKMRENENKYDGYLCPCRNEAAILFKIEIEQVNLFKETKVSNAKNHRDIINDEEKSEFDIWDIPVNGSILSGILDSPKRNKMINLIQTWHKEMKQNTPKVETQNKIIEKGKDTKLKHGKSEIREDDTKFQLEIRMKQANLLSESGWFYSSSPGGHYLGVISRSKDSLPPAVVSQLRPIQLKLGNLENLPMELLIKYGVKRIYTLVEFEDPLTNLQTIPQSVSKDVDLNFFKMIFFDDIKNYQRFFAAFYLKHMLIQVIGEIEKEKKKEEPTEVEEIPETVIEVPIEVQNEKTRGNKKTKGKNRLKKEKSYEIKSKELNTKSTDSSKKINADITIASKDITKDKLVLKEEPKRAAVTENIVIGENENVILIRICLFRIDLNRLVKLNHFHRIKETLTPSAVFDKEQITANIINEIETDEANYSMTVNMPRSKISKSDFSSSNTYDKGLSKQRSYLIGIDCKQTLTLEFDFHIQACFKNLCKELYIAGSNGLNNILVLFEEKLKMKELVNDIRNYNNAIQTQRPDSPFGNSPVITGFALEFSDVGIMFTETTIVSSFPLLLQWMLEVRDTLKKIIYNTSLIIPHRIYDGFRQENNGIFTYSNHQTFKNAFRRKTAPKQIYVSLCELLHVRSIEDIHKYQLLPDCSELESLKFQIK